MKKHVKNFNIFNKQLFSLLIPLKSQTKLSCGTFEFNYI